MKKSRRGTSPVHSKKQEIHSQSNQEHIVTFVSRQMYTNAMLTKNDEPQKDNQVLLITEWMYVDQSAQTKQSTEEVIWISCKTLISQL